MKLFFWDIDGTLIRTNGAGFMALNEAAETLHKQPVDLLGIKAAGMTDNYIVRQILLNVLGREPSAKEIASLCVKYEELLPKYLDMKYGVVMPRVLETLEELNKRDDCRLLLLTGNSKVGARLKMQRFGMEKFFDFECSAFAFEHEERIGIARHALNMAKQHWPEVSRKDIWVIGDTPNDILCGKGINVQTIGIATGVYSVEQLQEHNPSWVLSELPEPIDFIEKIWHD